MPSKYKNWVNVLLLSCTGFALVACGYGFNNQQISALPQGVQTIFLDSVENPTAETWLGPRIRSIFRDELHRRAWVQWSEKESADALLKIVVERFTRSSSAWDEDEESVKYSSNIKISATLIEQKTGKELWHSGRVDSSASYYATEESSVTKADIEALEQAIRRLADRMGEGY